MMGVDVANCRKVAELIGIKTFLNEFVAYDMLGKIVKNGVVFQAHTLANGTFTVNDLGDYLLTGTNVTLEGGVLTVSDTVNSA